MAYAKHENQLINSVPPISADISGLFESIKSFFANRRAIHQLEAMSNHQLHDIGITRTEIEAAVFGDLYR